MKSTLERTSHKTDDQLKTDIIAELQYEPSIKFTDLGVLVHDGVVTLNGHTDSYMGKREAVRSIKRIAGVKAIADEIELKMPGSVSHTDEDIAIAVAHHLEWSSGVPTGTVTATVRKGWITLEGEVEWQYMKNAAESVVHHLMGVKGVSNMISLNPKSTPTPTPTGVKSSIRSAFERSALLDANKIEVETSGSEVTLRGNVRNYDERDEAERVAWASPGISSVHNNLMIEWSYFT